MYMFLVGSVCLSIGFLLGFLIYPMIKKPDGIFHVNLSDPMKDVFWLELLRPLEGIQLCSNLFIMVKNDKE